MDVACEWGLTCELKIAILGTGQKFRLGNSQLRTHIDIKEAAIQLGISQQRVRYLCRQGDLLAYKVGNSWLLTQESLDRYGLITAHKVADNHPAYHLTKI